MLLQLLTEARSAKVGLLNIVEIHKQVLIFVDHNIKAVIVQIDGPNP